MPDGPHDGCSGRPAYRRSTQTGAWRHCRTNVDASGVMMSLSKWNCKWLVGVYTNRTVSGPGGTAELMWMPVE